jgi:hypothetical protein
MAVESFPDFCSEQVRLLKRNGMLSTAIRSLHGKVFCMAARKFIYELPISEDPPDDGGQRSCVFRRVERCLQTEL